MPFIDDMIANREEGLDQFNKMFGTNIKVKKSSSWEDNQQENDISHGGEADPEPEKNDPEGPDDPEDKKEEEDKKE